MRPPEHSLVQHPVKRQVLLLATSCSEIEGEPAGCWLPELAAAFYAFADNGFDVTIASPRGGEIPLDEDSLTQDKLDKESTSFLQQDAEMVQLKHSVPLAAITEPRSYDALFIAGGPGALLDLPHRSKDEATGSPFNQQQCVLHTLLEKMLEAGKVIGAVGCGVAAFVGWVDHTRGDQPAISDQLLTCLSLGEARESWTAGTQQQPGVSSQRKVALLQRVHQQLTQAGAKLMFDAAGVEHVLVSHGGTIVTAQNAASVAAAAKSIMKLLEAGAASPAGPKYS